MNSGIAPIGAPSPAETGKILGNSIASGYSKEILCLCVAREKIPCKKRLYFAAIVVADTLLDARTLAKLLTISSRQ
jgi:hypothetical protein